MVIIILLLSAVTCPQDGKLLSLLVKNLAVSLMCINYCYGKELYHLHYSTTYEISMVLRCSAFVELLLSNMNHLLTVTIFVVILKYHPSCCCCFPPPQGWIQEFAGLMGPATVKGWVHIPLPCMQSAESRTSPKF